MVTLTIPPDPEVLAVLRSTATAIGVRADLTLDSLDDLRMGVEEAALMLLALGQPITMSADPDVAPFTVRLSAPAASQIDRTPDDLSWMVLDGVTDTAEVHHNTEATTIVLSFGSVASAA